MFVATATIEAHFHDSEKIAYLHKMASFDRFIEHYVVQINLAAIRVLCVKVGN